VTDAPDKPLTRYMRVRGEPLSLSEYERAGGYAALRKGLSEMSPEDVTQVVSESMLRGRGGAGFPTGKKWSFVPMGEEARRPKYLVANADEMEPGTFKDRLLMEEDPHQFIEGIALSAYAIEADVAYIFLRWAYKKSEQRLRRALHEAYEAGHLGRDIHGSGYSLDVHLHTSAGRYMCGEETGLLNALEGRRATPRHRPPYPQISGLWGQPTVVQNVETLSNVPPIILHGPEWYRGLSHTDDGGTKLYGVSGKVQRPGVWELPMGTTVREIIEEHAGGMRNGLSLRGLLPGGASTGFLTADHLDLKMDYSSIQGAGSRLGTGTLIVLDDQTCPVGMLMNLQKFFAQESCGWCTPCRDGLPWVHKILEALEEGRGRMEDLDRLDDHTRFLGMGFTFCALAPGAMEPLETALTYFRDDFEAHIRHRACPWRSAH